MRVSGIVKGGRKVDVLKKYYEALKKEEEEEEEQEERGLAPVEICLHQTH
jgi:hypothetical protein